MPKPTVEELAKQIEDLQSKTAHLESKVAWFEKIMEVRGISGPWVTTSEAGTLLCISAQRIRIEIERAEEQRALHKRPDLKYGVHYRNDQDLGSTRPSWKVQVSKFAEILTIPPDQRLM